MTRLNKYISHNTKFSRREADELIRDGKVKVNGRIVEHLATNVTDKDKVLLFNKPVRRRKNYTLIAYYKKKGELVTKKDDRGRKTIYDSLPKKYASYVPVGRLDFASTGLLILTNAVDIANMLMHGNWERTYYVKIKGSVSERMVEAMDEGLTINSTKGAHHLNQTDDLEFAPFVKYKIIKNAPDYSKLKVTISEGKNRELRRFFAHFDREVTDLKRVEFGGISLDLDKEGKYRYFTNGEYESVREVLYGLEKKI